MHEPKLPAPEAPLFPIASEQAADGGISRRTILRGAFLGLSAATMPAWMGSRALAQSGPGATELVLPVGPLANLDPLVKQTLTSGALPGVDDRVYAPQGFEVRCVARHGLNPVTGAADQGYLWHKDPDGGAVYPAPDGGWVYVSNSEETPGGVGAIRFDADGNVIDAYRILDGTRNNCAGGETPWGTWLSCEETGGGLVYECDPFGSPETAVVKPALGALNHEAAAIDPINHVCYETEDGGTNKFYRFVSAPEDLSLTEDGITRMGLENGTLQVANVAGFENNGQPADEDVREPLQVTWVDVDPTGLNAMGGTPQGTRLFGTHFAQGEGIWYYEIPEELRVRPHHGTVPTRGVIFFATKGDNRVWAYDIENELIETIYDTTNDQTIDEIDGSGNQVAGGRFNQVDNVVVSPAGDVLVAEDGSKMRLVVMVPNDQPALLMQITGGGSEITGPAFTPDGSRLYFSSQRGPDGMGGNTGATYEIMVPDEFRVISPQQFTFRVRTDVALGATVTSEEITLTGMRGKSNIVVSGGETRVNGGSWTGRPQLVANGDRIRVRHRAADEAASSKTTAVAVGTTQTLFESVTLGADTRPDAFGFGLLTNQEPNTLVASSILTPTGFTSAAAVQPGIGAEYSINGGPFIASAGDLSPGDTIQVRHRTAKESLRYRKSSVTIGGQRGYFTTRTKQL